MININDYQFVPEVDHFVNTIKSSGLFFRVGLVFDGVSPQVNSWEEAVASAACVDNRNVGIEAANQIRRQLPDPVYQTWNLLAIPVRQLIDNVIEPVLRLHFDEGKVPQFAQVEARKSVRWDLGHYIIESEYRNYLSTNFFQGTVEYYLSGHFPCGWVGKFPNGLFLLY